MFCKWGKRLEIFFNQSISSDANHMDTVIIWVEYVYQEKTMKDK